MEIPPDAAVPLNTLAIETIAEQDEGFRKEGMALWPERFSLETLNQIREAVGSAAWASLYQQRPAAAEGAIFKRTWWRFYRQAPKFSQVREAARRAQGCLSWPSC